MPAPQASAMESAALGLLEPKMAQQKYTKALVKAFMTEVSTQWTTWAMGMTWGKNDVSGIGIGVWSGSGQGGKIKASPFSVSGSSIFSMMNFPKKTPPTEKLLNTFAEVINKQFDAWAKDFLIDKPVSYLGTCSALPPAPPALPVGAPGPFSATSIAVPLIALGTGPAPSGIDSAWNDKLKAGEPAFKLDHPLVMTKLLTKAIGSTIELQFKTVFLTTSMASGDTVSGTGAPGTGQGSGKSDGIGKII